MKKTGCLLFILLFFASCSRAFASQNIAEFQVKTNLIGFSPKEKKKIDAASRLIKSIVNSEEFRRKVLNHTWEGKKQFANNLGLSNKEIYQRIIEGAEKLSHEGANNSMDLDIELYSDYDSITIGYTYPSISKIYMNRKYFHKFKPFHVADNMMHEWLHKIGFGHAVKNTTERSYSVPYAIGYIVKDMGRPKARPKDMNLLAEE